MAAVGDAATLGEEGAAMHLGEEVLEHSSEEIAEHTFVKVEEEVPELVEENIEKNIKYIGRMEDLKNIPREQTLLDELPYLGDPKLDYYQNMSVLRKALRDGYEIKDASWFRLGSEGAPTRLNPSRLIKQTFLGAERNLLNNRGLWP